METKLAQNSITFYPVVPFDAETDKLLLMDFTANNLDLTTEILADTKRFSRYVSETLERNGAVYGIGGYDELREIYTRSGVFDATETFAEPRRLHLGIDIWGKVGTPVFAPLGGTVHSFAFNDRFGDYGATIVLLHQLNGTPFHTLYGHLSVGDLTNLEEGKYISLGEIVGHFGEPFENGHWPPHLHFQIIKDMDKYWGDYPGVCAVSQKDTYLHNCPNPDQMLGMMPFATKGNR